MASVGKGPDWGYADIPLASASDCDQSLAVTIAPVARTPLNATSGPSPALANAASTCV